MLYKYSKLSNHMLKSQVIFRQWVHHLVPTHYPWDDPVGQLVNVYSLRTGTWPSRNVVDDYPAIKNGGSFQFVIYGKIHHVYSWVNPRTKSPFSHQFSHQFLVNVYQAG